MKGQLTKAEEQVMQQLWQLGEAFLRELVESFEGKQPHQNTVATILKTLAVKGFVNIALSPNANSTDATRKKSQISILVVQ